VARREARAAALLRFVFTACVWFWGAPGLSQAVLSSAFAKKKPHEPSAPTSESGEKIDTVDCAASRPERDDRASPGDLKKYALRCSKEDRCHPQL
jgi:hypothetical protein